MNCKTVLSTREHVDVSSVGSEKKTFLGFSVLVYRSKSHLIMPINTFQYYTANVFKHFIFFCRGIKPKFLKFKQKFSL